MLRPKRRFLRPHPRLLFRAAGSAFSILGVIIAARPAAAQVTGEQVVSGQAAFHRNGANTTITAANNTIINYQQFSIAPGATVRFIQPDSASRVLNRVTGPDPSTIAGSLIANGIVYIVNPAGVYFRQGALVDVAGIYAAAGHIADADFLSGVNRFTDVGGRVVNQGAIHAHTAALIGSVVSNEGVIESPGGVVTLVAGDEVLLGERGSAIYVRMNPPSGPEEADPASGHAGADGGPAPMPGSPRVSNSGTINARTGRASLVVGDVYGVAIRNTGTVRARAIEARAEGRGAVEIAGTLDASGPAAGPALPPNAPASRTIDVIGGYVLINGATLDASGAGGGGTIRVGGGFQGRGLPSATNTIVAPGSVLRADAIGAGNGGLIVVWSDGFTGFYGSASAAGGAIGGNGGLIETSGRIHLDVRSALVSAAAVAGRAGTWLLDPSDITITTSTSGGSFSGGVPDVFNPTGAGNVSSDVDVATIAATLQGGTSVAIQTYNPSGTSPGNITVATPISVNVSNGPVTLTLRAAGNIEFTAGNGVTASNGPLSLVLEANNRFDINVPPGTPNPEPPPPSPSAGDVIIGANISLNGGSFNSSGSGFTNTGFTISTTSAGSITLNHTGAVEVGAALTGGSVSITGGSVTLGADLTATNAAGSVSITGPITLAAHTAIASGSGGISFSGAADGGFNLTLTAGTGSIFFNGAVGGTTRLGDLSIVSAANVSGSSVRAASITQSAGTGTTTFTGLLDTNTAPGISLTGSAFTLSGGATTTTGGTFTLANSGASSLSGTYTLDGAFSQTGAGGMTLNAAITTTNDAVSFNAPVTLGGNSSISTGAGVGDITFTDTLDGGFNLTLTAGTGSIFFNGAVGGTTRLGDLAIVSAANVSGSSVRAASITQSAGTGTTSFTGLLDTNTASGISLTGSAFTLSGGATTTTGGTFTLANSAASSLSGTYTLDGAFSQTGAGGVTLNAAITTTNDAVSFNAPVTLGGNSSISTGAGVGDITFSSTLDGGFNLSLTAGTGSIFFNGAVGGTTRLGDLAIVSAANVSGSSLRAASITQSAGTGTTTFTGLLDTNTASGISLTGSAFTLSGGVATTTGGTFTLANSGASSLSGTYTLDGAFGQTGAGGVTLNGAITTTNDAVSFNAPVTLGGNSSISTGAGVGDITFSSTLDGGFNLSLTAGIGSVFFSAPVGGITPLADLAVVSAANVSGSSISAATISQSAGTGTTSLTGTLTTTGAGGIVLVTQSIALSGGAATTGGGGLTLIAPTSISLTGAPVDLDGAFFANGPTSISTDITTTGDGITFNSAVTLTGPVALSTGAGVGDITFVSTLNGAQSLALTAGIGAINFVGPVGGTTRLGAVTVNSVANLSALDTFRAASFTQSAGSGTTFFAGTLDTSAAGGIAITTNTITLVAGAVTAAGGPATFTNAGALTLIGTFTLDGALTQNGAGPVSINGDFSTTNDAVQFLRAVTLLGDSSISTGSGPLTFASTLDGGFDLTLSGSGTTLFAAPVGGITPLANLFNNRTGAISIGGNQSSAGDLIHAGPVTLLANAAFQGGPLVGNQVTFGSTLDGAFAVTISSGGTNTITGAAGAGNPLASLAMTGEANRVADVTTTGAQTYTADSTRLAGDLTSSNAPITFNGQTLLATDLTIDAGSGNILFNNPAAAAIDSESPGNFDLTLITTGQATIDGHAGSVRALGSLTTVGNSVTRIGGDVTATEGLFFGNNLRLIASSVLDAGNGPARFLGTINSEGAPRDLSILSAAPTINGLASAETLRGYQVPIAFAGSIGDTLALNSLGLNYNVARAADGRASVPSVATIVFANSLNADGTITAASINPATNFVINVVNGFTMGQNEKLTAFGNLSITAALARLSDLSTIGNMAVTAPTIQLRVRPAGQVAGFSSLDLPTVANDQGLDFVAGGTIAFSTAPTAVNGPAFSAGGLPRPSFSNPDGTGDVNGTLLAFPFRAFGSDPLLPQFTDRPAPNNIQAIAFDLRSDGPTRQNVSESIAAFVVVDMPRVPEESSVGLAQRKQLEEIAIFVRDLGPDELIEALIGRALYNDKPQTVRVEDASQRRVSAGRLSFDGVKAILAEYTAILQVQGDLTSALADAVTAWFAEHPDSDFDARSFAAFLLARDESDPARQSALRVARLFVMVEELGLARYELRDCKRAIVGQILPPDLSAAQLVQTIDAINVTLRPERYPAAGGDVVTPPAPTSSPRPSDVKPSPEPDATPENPAGPANLPAPPLARR